MKKLRLIIGSMLTIFAIIVSDDVFALKCNYNYSGYKSDSAVWSVDSSKNKPANMEINIFGGLGTDAGREPVLNWSSSTAGNYKAKNDFDNNKCPDYLIQKYTGNAYEVYMASESSLMAILNTDDVQKHGWGADSSVIVFKNANRTKPSKKGVVCKYKNATDINGLLVHDSFTLNYDENGNLIGSDYEASDQLLKSAFLVSYTAFETPLKSNACNTSAYLCSPMFIDPEYGYPYYEVFLNAQGFLEEDKTFNANSTGCIQYKFDQEGSTSESGEKPTSDSACEAVDTYLNDLRIYAEQYKACKDAENCVNGGSLNEFTQTEERLQTYCNSVYKVSYYSDSCSQACVGVDTEIAKIKSTNGMGVGDGGGNSSCSLSERFVGWIFKIIQWIRYLVPILLIVLSVMDFIKAVASDSEDEIRKVGAKFVKRLIVAAIIFVLPLILEFLLGIFGIHTNDYCLSSK